MIDKLTSRPALYATSFLCLAGLTLVVTRPMLDDPNYGNIGIQAEHESPQEAGKLSSQLGSDDSTKQIGITSPNIRADKTTTKRKSAQTMQTLESTMPKAVKRIAPANIEVSDLAGMVAPAPQADQQINPPKIDSETFANKPENTLKTVADDPVSTFSIDVDTAAYSYVRAAINNGQLPHADAVRIEEMINYFPYDYTTPDMAVAPFSTDVNVFQTPWNADTKLLHIGIQGAKPAIDNRPPLNLVFLIDTSGSMQAQNKLPLLKQSFRLLLNTLRPDDQVAIVTYAGSAGMALEPTAAKEKSKILASLNKLRSGGSTAGQAGLQQAYSLAEQMHTEGSVERVLLATDGDFNVGINDPDALKSFVEQKRDTGVYLSVFGFGRGNYRDDMMQSLAQNGNGTAAYIDTLAEAQKILVDQVSGALLPIANDVKIQIEFNPEQIAEYRLIGYETRALRNEDFNNDAVDAGEIGAGHTVTALYEVTPVGSPAIKNNPLRYAQEDPKETATNISEYGFLKLRYKIPGETNSKLIETPIPADTDAPNEDAKFAAAIAGFGQLLSNGKYLGEWGWDNAIDLAIDGKGTDAYGYRAEAIQLMRLGKSLDN